MKIIISGGTGLIGRALVNLLLRQKHDIVVLTRTPDRYKSTFISAVKLVLWDYLNPAAWANHIEGADAIINLAGESIAGENFVQLGTKRWTQKQKNHILESRVGTGRAFIEAIELVNSKPSVFVQASAVGYYSSTGNEPLTENSNSGSGFIANVCKQWEASTEPLEKLGIRRVIIRTPGSVLSTRGGSLPYMMLPFKLFLGGPIGDGSQWFSWVHILDEVRAINYLLEDSSLNGPFNLSAPEPVTNLEFSKTLGGVLRRPVWLPIPTIALRIIFGEKSQVLTTSQRQIPERLMQAGFKFYYPILQMALSNILMDSRII